MRVLIKLDFFVDFFCISITFSQCPDMPLLYSMFNLNALIHNLQPVQESPTQLAVHNAMQQWSTITALTLQRYYNYFRTGQDCIITCYYVLAFQLQDIKDIT